MNKYDSYKDSGVEWIGSIPKSWSLKRIKHTTYVKGRIGWKGLRSDEFKKESDSIAVTGTDFQNGKIDWENCYQISRDRYDEDPYIQLKEDDLLITKDGTIGKIALVEDIPKVATLNSGIFVTRPLDMEYSNKFLYWVLVSDIFSAFYDFNKSGSTIQHLYQNVFNEFNYPLPSKQEQTAIATYLDKKTTEIDKLISKKERFIELLEEEKTAIINQAVTKGLDSNVPMKDSGIKGLGNIPEHWQVILFKRIVEKIKDGTHGTFKRVDNGYPFLSAKNVFNQGLFIGENESQVSEECYKEITKNGFPKKNDLLITCVGTIGRTMVYEEEKPIAFQRSVTFLRLDETKANPYFYKWYVQSHYFQNTLTSLAKTSAQSGVYMSDLSNSISLLLPLKEQAEIVSFLDDKIDNIEALKSKFIKEINYLKEYKTALISNVVTGKIDVRDKVTVN